MIRSFQLRKVSLLSHRMEQRGRRRKQPPADPATMISLPLRPAGGITSFPFHFSASYRHLPPSLNTRKEWEGGEGRSGAFLSLCSATLCCFYSSQCNTHPCRSGGSHHQLFAAWKARPKLAALHETQPPVHKYIHEHEVMYACVHVMWPKLGLIVCRCVSEAHG